MEMSDLRKMENFIWHSMTKDMTYVFVCPEGKQDVVINYHFGEPDPEVTVDYTERW